MTNHAAISGGMQNIWFEMSQKVRNFRSICQL
jgi:hypothetical protein